MTPAQLAAEAAWQAATHSYRQDGGDLCGGPCGGMSVRPVWTRGGVVVMCDVCGWRPREGK